MRPHIPLATWFTCLTVLISCGTKRQVVQRPTGQNSDSCSRAGPPVDSARAVKQARDALKSSESVRVLDPKSIEHLNEGYLVRMTVTSPPTLGGGGLVWVDGESGCAVVLTRYE